MSLGEEDVMKRKNPERRMIFHLHNKDLSVRQTSKKEKKNTVVCE
jgi:hypothetical protein